MVKIEWHYRFPSDPKQQQIWIDIITRHNNSCRTVKDKQYEYHNRQRVCERHFPPDCLNLRGNKKYLKPKSVPSIFKSIPTTQLTEILTIRNKMKIIQQQFLNKVLSANKSRQLNEILNNVRHEMTEMIHKINHLYDNECGE